METFLIGPCFLSPCFPLCTDQGSGYSLWWAQFRLPGFSFELLSGLSTSCVFNDPLWSAGKMLRGWFCLCSCSRMGFCLLRSRSMGQMCTEVMHVLRNSQAFKDAFKASPFYCWDTDVLLEQILLSPYSSSCASRSVISREANISAVLVKGRPIILWHQVLLSPHPYTAHLLSGPEGTGRLNFKWQTGIQISLAHLGFRRNIW